jgi:hypothetical protein
MEVNPGKQNRYEFSEDEPGTQDVTPRSGTELFSSSLAKLDKNFHVGDWG